MDDKTIPPPTETTVDLPYPRVINPTHAWWSSQAFDTTQVVCVLRANADLPVVVERHTPDGVSVSWSMTDQDAELLGSRLLAAVAMRRARHGERFRAETVVAGEPR